VAGDFSHDFGFWIQFEFDLIARRMPGEDKKKSVLAGKVVLQGR
jgi:hypothetical protein